MTSISRTETYLSLLMIHRIHAHQGISQQVYGALETFVRLHESLAVCIDVMTGYDDRVWDFWIRNGFDAVENITLEWNGATLPASVVTKAVATTETGR